MKIDFLWEEATCSDGIPSLSMLHKPIVFLQVCAWCIYDCCSCGVPTLSPLPTSHSRPSWECVSPFISPINIPPGSTELVGSLGAETPPSTPASCRAKWEWEELSGRRLKGSGGRFRESGSESVAVWGRRGRGGSEAAKKWVKRWKTEGRQSWRFIWLIETSREQMPIRLWGEIQGWHCVLFQASDLTVLIWLSMFPLFFSFFLL